MRLGGLWLRRPGRYSGESGRMAGVVERKESSVCVCVCVCVCVRRIRETKTDIILRRYSRKVFHVHVQYCSQATCRFMRVLASLVCESLDYCTRAGIPCSHIHCECCACVCLSACVCMFEYLHGTYASNLHMHLSCSLVILCR